MISGLGLSIKDTNLVGTKEQRIKDAAGELESMFIYYMLKEMHQDIKDPLFGSNQQKMYQDMQDMQISRVMAKKSPFGLADMLCKEFSDVRQ